MSPIAQDLTCPFTLRIEEMRRLPRPRGPRGLVFELIRQLMIALLQLVLSVVEQRRARELAAAAACGGAVDGMSEQPELPAEITEPIAEAPQVDRSARTPGVEPAGGPKPARRARVRRLQDPSGPVPARALHVDDRAWPRSRGAGLLWTAGAGFLRVDSEKSVLAGWDSCVHFVTISK